MSTDITITQLKVKILDAFIEVLKQVHIKVRQINGDTPAYDIDRLVRELCDLRENVSDYEQSLCRIINDLTNNQLWRAGGAGNEL